MPVFGVPAWALGVSLRLCGACWFAGFLCTVIVCGVMCAFAC